MDRFFQRYVCIKCKYGQVVTSCDFAFLGCYHKPYKGKWIVELDKCPLNKKLHLCNECIYECPGYDNITNCDRFIPKEGA